MSSTTEPPSRSITPAIIAALIVLAVAWSVVVVTIGGVDVRVTGMRIRSTTPDRAVYAAVLLSLVYFAFYRSHARRFAQTVARWIPNVAIVERVAPAVVVVLAAGMCLVSTATGPLVAGGSDSWGYVSQADLWLKGSLVVDQPIARQVPWPDGDLTFSPVGYRPGLQPGTMVPFYSFGLPVLMAGGKLLLGACGPFVISPLLAGLTIWLTFVLGRMVASAIAGLAAAALLATSPVFLFMAQNPMSDVPVTAFFLLGLVTALSSSRWRELWTGLAVSVGVFIRPNLLLVGAVFLAFVVLRARVVHGEPAWRARVRAFAWFSVGGAPLVVAIAWVNTILYGAPWKSGYGTLDQYYALGYVWRNVVDYSRWLWEKETPFIALAAVPLLLWRTVRERDRRFAFIVSFAAVVWFSYLFYLPFGFWVYMRFLLPAIPVMLVLAVIGFGLLLQRLPGGEERATVAVLVLAAVFALRVGEIRREELLGHWREGVPYSSVGAYVRDRLPANAVIITVQHSGSIRYYANRLTMRWDLLDPAWWPRALDVLVERGYRPYLLVVDFELPVLRKRFGLSAAEEAPGTIIATLPEPEPLRIYDPLRELPPSRAVIPAVVARPCGCILP